MISDLIVVLLILIGLETVICWILRFCFWFIEKLIKGENNAK